MCVRGGRKLLERSFPSPIPLSFKNFPEEKRFGKVLVKLFQKFAGLRGAEPPKKPRFVFHINSNKTKSIIRSSFPLLSESKSISAKISSSSLPILPLNKEFKRRLPNSDAGFASVSFAVSSLCAISSFSTGPAGRSSTPHRLRPC